MKVVPTEYDPKDDLARSISWAYRYIRARVAAGGKGWRGYPMNDHPLIERPDQKTAERFMLMATRIERNPQEFGGACVIVPPAGGNPIEFLLIDTKGDMAQFYSTIMTKIQVQLEELKSQQQVVQGFGRR